MPIAFCALPAYHSEFFKGTEVERRGTVASRKGLTLLLPAKRIKSAWSQDANFEAARRVLMLVVCPCRTDIASPLFAVSAGAYPAPNTVLMYLMAVASTEDNVPRLPIQLAQSNPFVDPCCSIPRASVKRTLADRVVQRPHAATRLHPTHHCRAY